MGTRILIQSVVEGACTAALVAAAAHWFALPAEGITALCSGIAVTTVLVFRRWPSEAGAAEIVDSQLAWKQLLQSARAVQDTAPGSMGAAVVADANARCSAIRLCDLPVAPISSVRAAGIAVAMILAAGLWVLTPVQSRGTSQGASVAAAETADQPANAPLTADRDAAPISQPKPEPGERSNRPGESNDAPAGSGGTGGQPPSHDAGEKGAGAAESKADPAAGVHVAGAAHPDSVGRVAGGDNAAADDGTPGSADGLGVVTSPAAPVASPASIGSSNALAAGPPSPSTVSNVSASQGPDADLVRAFFAR